MKAKIVNLDGNYSRPVITDDGETSSVAEYFEYHRPYQPASLGVGSIVDVLDVEAEDGGYPAECILITSNEPIPTGERDWYLGLLPSNLEMISESKSPRRGRGEVRVYQDPQDEAFDKSGLDDSLREDYEKGWNEGMSQEEQLQSMTPEEYQRKLGEETTIVNFNGKMTLFENKAYNGKMTEYVLSQMMYGYVPMSLGIGYKVNLVDWVHNPDPETFVVVSSPEIVPEEYAAPNIKAAQGHWTLYLRKENLEMFQPKEVSEAMLGLAKDFDMTGEVAEIDLDVLDESMLMQYSGRDVLIAGRGELYVQPRTGDLKKMERPEKGWRKVERVKVMGAKFDSILSEVVSWANESSKVSVKSNSDTEVVLTAEDSDTAERVAKAFNKTGMFTAQVSGSDVSVGY